MCSPQARTTLGGVCACVFFNDTATTEIYTLSLHDALPILRGPSLAPQHVLPGGGVVSESGCIEHTRFRPHGGLLHLRSEEHTSELQSRQYLVCRLLLEKKHDSTSDTATSCCPLAHLSTNTS